MFRLLMRCAALAATVLVVALLGAGTTAAAPNALWTIVHDK